MPSRNNLILSSGFLCIVIIGIAVFFLSGSSVKDGAKKFSIDYNNLEILAESHPRGDSILATIRENEQFLFDDDENNDIGAHLSIGFNVRQLGDDRLAISAYKEVLRIDEDHLLALNNIAVSYTDIGEYKNAEEAYRKLVSANPGDVPVYRKLAGVYALQHPDDDEGIVAIIESGLEVVIEPADLVSYLATYYRDRGNTSKAIEYFETLVRIMPDNEAAQNELERLRK